MTILQTSDMDRNQRKLQEAKAEEDTLKQEIVVMQTRVAELDAETKRYRGIVNETEVRLTPVRVRTNSNMFLCTKVLYI